MHLARLYDPAKIPHDYSLAKLSEIYSREIAYTKEMMYAYLNKKYKNDTKKLASIKNYEITSKKLAKVDLKHTFGFHKVLKNGSLGKVLLFPDIEEMHTTPKYVEKWVEYSAFDADITFFLRESLAYELCKIKIDSENMHNMYDLYCKYWMPFGELLTDMEREGIMIDIPQMQQKQADAEADRDMHKRKFLNWVYSIMPDCKEFNPASSSQLQQLLFAPFNKLPNPKK